MSLVTVDGLGFSYPALNGDPAFTLKDVSFSLEKGELLGILGPNGSGKSTLLKLLCRSLRADAGRILLSGDSVDQLSQKAVARRVAMVPQEMSTIFAITVEQMVALGRFPHHGLFGWKTSRDESLIDRVLERTDLAPMRHRLTARLSGGERRRVLLARALAQEPQVLLLDEPTAHLDPRHQVEFLRLVEELRQSQGLAVIVVLHDLNLALSWCRRLLFMKAGSVVAQGPAEEVFTQKLFEQVYETPAKVVSDPETARNHVNFFLTLNKNQTRGGNK